jgi:hypothetical protein
MTDGHISRNGHGCKLSEVNLFEEPVGLLKVEAAKNLIK